MAITADLNGKNYTLGRGKLYFDRYADGITIAAATQGEGERYFGNTPSFATSSSSENLDHFDSDAGVRVKDDSVQLSFDRTGSITCDNISSENIALQFLGTSAPVTQAPVVGAVTTRAVKRGRFYQLGATPALPAGVRKISNLVVTKASTVIVLTGNYEVDPDLARVFIEQEAVAIADDDVLTFTFDVDASTRTQVISGNKSIYGALRFVADNPKGTNRDFYFPYVKLTPDGDYAFKGDDWQVMTFALEILKKASNVESAYVDGRAVAVV